MRAGVRVAYVKKSQSAMEYLMTYGWAILVISIVLASLWQLGVFNSAAQSPREQPGACRVMRNQAVGGGVQTALMGACGNLLPQFVAQFDGASSYISTGMNNFPTGSSPDSGFAWVDITYPGVSGVGKLYAVQLFGGASGLPDQYFWLGIGYVTTYTPVFSEDGFVHTCSGQVIAYNTWHQIGWTYDGSTTLNLYVDGVVTQCTITQANLPPISSDISYIGGYPGNYNFNGLVSNVQLYNSTLSAGEVKALYNEGIGGAPLPLPSLVGWWPLNGNPNDYSGNKNSGTPYNVKMNSTWASGYIVP